MSPGSLAGLPERVRDGGESARPTAAPTEARHRQAAWGGCLPSFLSVSAPEGLTPHNPGQRSPLRLGAAGYLPHPARWPLPSRSAREPSHHRMGVCRAQRPPWPGRVRPRGRVLREVLLTRVSRDRWGAPGQAWGAAQTQGWTRRLSRSRAPRDGRVRGRPDSCWPRGGRGLRPGRPPCSACPPAAAGLDRGQREEHPRTAVHAAHRAVGRREPLDARGHGRPGDARAGEEAVPPGRAGGAPRQGERRAGGPGGGGSGMGAGGGAREQA